MVGRIPQHQTALQIAFHISLDLLHQPPLLALALAVKQLRQLEHAPAQPGLHVRQCFEVVENIEIPHLQTQHAVKILIQGMQIGIQPRNNV
ncbi:hypothetical protein D3C75_1266840 [compost metagenome]